MLEDVVVPDIGAYENVAVIEVFVSVGDKVEKDASLITLETDKAALEVPSPVTGVVKAISIKVGDRVSAGSLILQVEVANKPEANTQKEVKTSAVATHSEIIKEILVPDIGDYKNVSVIEVSVKEGDSIQKEASLITLETEKAALEVPSPFAGIVQTVSVKVGDKVSEGNLILKLTVKESAGSVTVAEKVVNTNTTKASSASAPVARSEVAQQTNTPSHLVHAGPGVRRFARELGVELGRVKATGPKNRLLKQDIQAYVKAILTGKQAGGGDGGFSVLPWPEVDFSKFGAIEQEPLSRIKKLSGTFLHRNWVRVPHITQFDEADITEMEAFRKAQQPVAQKEGVKLTPLIFIMKAVVLALKEFKSFNASLDTTGEILILKKYYHIGVAVDTPNGLVVPVIRDVDQKGLFQLAKELGEISERARQGQLSGAEMQGSSFSISSLGGIGGTAFTPIINVPDVAILGVSKAEIKPVFMDGEFKPRLKLPLSLSYDHRVIDGAAGARFITFLAKQLADVNHLSI